MARGQGARPEPGDQLYAHDFEPSSRIATVPAVSEAEARPREEMRAKTDEIMLDLVRAGMIKRWLPDKGYMIDLLRPGLGGPASAGGKAAMKTPEEVYQERSEKHDALSWLKFVDTLINQGVASGDACILACRAGHE